MATRLSVPKNVMRKRQQIPRNPAQPSFQLAGPSGMERILRPTVVNKTISSKIGI